MFFAMDRYQEQICLSNNLGVHIIYGLLLIHYRHFIRNIKPFQFLPSLNYIFQ